MLLVGRAWRQRFYSAKTAILLDWNGSTIAPTWKNLLAAAKKLSSSSSSPSTQTAVQVTAILPVPAGKAQPPEGLQLPGISRLVLAPLRTPHRAAEEVAVICKSVLEHFKLQNLLAIHDSFGKNCVPRLAAIVDQAAVSLSDVLSIDAAGQAGQLAFSRSIYAGNAVAKLATNASSPHFITIRPAAFEPESAAAAAESSMERVAAQPVQHSLPVSSFVSRDLNVSQRPELSSAKVVVAGGRALKSAENFAKLLDPLADALGAAVGASRAAVDAGFVSNDLQVGQTGKIVAPQLYIAVGISGAIQHVAGMKDSKVIVAINKDPECPIFQVADYGLVGDLFTIIPELTEKLKSRK